MIFVSVHHAYTLDLGIGVHTIWVKGKKQVCILYDTVAVEVKSEFGIDDLLANRLEVYPNPCQDKLIIEVKQHFNQIEIYNVNGIRIYLQELKPADDEILTIPLATELPGVYFIKVITNDSMVVQKVIKL